MDSKVVRQFVVGLVAVSILALALPAVATSAVSTDFDADRVTVAGAFPVPWGDPNIDLDANTIKDADEWALLAAILADPAKIGHDAIHAAYVANVARSELDLAAYEGYGPLQDSVCRISAAYLTIGDLAKVAVVASIYNDLGVTLNPANYDLTNVSILGGSADPDEDGLDNVTEYAMAGGNRTQYIINALTPFVPPVEPVSISVTGGGWVEEGDAIVFTAGPAGAVSYQWYKNGGAIGSATSSVYTIASATLSDSGQYYCQINTGAKAIVNTPTVTVIVFAEGALPFAGVLGVGLLLGVLAAGGAYVIRRKR
jgi:hypothetical protein